MQKLTLNSSKLFIILISFSLSLTTFSDYEIETSSGIVDGFKKNRVLNWDDIPYAKPPIGDLRWKAPRKIENSKSLILPKENNFCVQRPSNLGGPGGDGLYVGTEDCLYLDVSAPLKNSSEPLPVMFWIHGGGNTSGLKDLYDFNKIIRKHNVIIVRINLKKCVAYKVYSNSDNYNII